MCRLEEAHVASAAPHVSDASHVVRFVVALPATANATVLRLTVAVDLHSSLVSKGTQAVRAVLDLAAQDVSNLAHGGTYMYIEYMSRVRNECSFIPFGDLLADKLHT